MTDRLREAARAACELDGCNYPVCSGTGCFGCARQLSEGAKVKRELSAALDAEPEPAWKRYEDKYGEMSPPRRPSPSDERKEREFHDECRRLYSAPSPTNEERPRHDAALTIAYVLTYCGGKPGQPAEAVSVHDVEKRWPQFFRHVVKSYAAAEARGLARAEGIAREIQLDVTSAMEGCDADRLQALESMDGVLQRLLANLAAAIRALGEE